MFTKAILTAAAVALAAPAAAQSLRAGQANLARSVGVAPGALSTQELVLLKQAIQDNDFQRRDRLLARADRAPSVSSDALFFDSRNGPTPRERALAERARVFFDSEAHRNSD